MKRRGLRVYGSPQLSLPGTSPARGEPWARCDCCGESLPCRAVLTWHSWELLLTLDPPGRAPKDLEEGSAQERLCGACAPGRWESAVRSVRSVKGWRWDARRVVLVVLADLAARGTV